MYLSFSPSDEAEAVRQLAECIKEVILSMGGNYLIHNDDKADFIILGSKQPLKHTLKRSQTHQHVCQLPLVILKLGYQKM